MDQAAVPVTGTDTCSTPRKPGRRSIPRTTAVPADHLPADRPKLKASRTTTNYGQGNSSGSTSGRQVKLLSMSLSRFMRCMVAVGTMNVHKIQVPSLLDTPNEFWMLFHALAHQLGTYFKSSPNVLRPYHWETDGCICRYLFPPLTPEQKSDLVTRYTLQRCPPELTPLQIRQIRFPQTTFLESNK